MAYDTQLADRVRALLQEYPGWPIEEKKMFGGLGFLVHQKMCVNISGKNLMCRFDPALQKMLAEKPGYLPMVMRGKTLAGYCLVSPEGSKTKKQIQFWIQHCLDFNKQARSSKKKN